MNVELLVVQGRPAGKVLVFAPGDYYLGRGPECQVRFNSDWVSRQHCLIRVTADHAVLRDLGSRNGTLINGTLLAGEHTLCAGDHLQIGPVVFEVRFPGPGPSQATEGPPALLQPVDEEPPSPEPTIDSTTRLPIVRPDNGQE